MSRIILIVVLSALTLLSGVAEGRGNGKTDDNVVHNIERVQAAIQRGVAFLIESQNEDGSWGGPQNAVYTFTGQVWSNPETHRTWKAATSGLWVLTLLENAPTPEGRAAAEKAVDFLLENAAVKRPSGWDTMNSWAYMYGLQALADAHEHPWFADSPKRAEMKRVGHILAERLEKYQSLKGGWGYLELDPPRTVRPQWGTSFSTASGVIALKIAQDADFTVDERMLARAVRAVAKSKLPNGAYSYHMRREVPNMHSEYIDQVKGSLSRIQVCNVAQVLAGREIPENEIQWGLDQFFMHHRFLDIARNRPIPHETFYYNSGYFYLYGHYYAAMAIELLPEDERPPYWARLRHEVMKIQQADGSMWDYDMHSYHKPYGTSFGVLALGRSLGAGRAVSPNNEPEPVDVSPTIAQPNEEKTDSTEPADTK